MTTATLSPSVIDRVRSSMTKTAHRAASLLDVSVERVHFDPALKKHRRAAATYFKTGRWTLRFYVEVGDHDVVGTIRRKLIDYALRDVADEA